MRYILESNAFANFELSNLRQYAQYLKSFLEYPKTSLNIFSHRLQSSGPRGLEFVRSGDWSHLRTVRVETAIAYHVNAFRLNSVSKLIN